MVDEREVGDGWESLVVGSEPGFGEEEEVVVEGEGLEVGEEGA